MILETFFLFMLIFMPYSIIGEGLGSVFITFIGGLFLIKYRNSEIKINKLFFYLLLCLFGLGVISLIFTSNLVSSLVGLTIYINAIVFYLIFKKLECNKNKIMLIITYLISISSIVFIIYEGVLLKNRIDGNFGYANTYGLILLIGLYLNEIININFHKNLHGIIQVILMLGIIYSGSRNSFVYLVLFIILNSLSYFILNKNKVNPNEVKAKKSKQHMKARTDKGINLTAIISFLISIGLYISLQYLGFALIILIPLVLYFTYLIFNKLPSKVKNCITIIFSGVIFSGFIFIDSGFFSRIKEISVKTSVLQERFVFFQDSLKHIINTPLGSGINSFEYTQYAHQSAFYDVRYIHNSILQIGYDLGIVAMLLFIVIMIYGGIYIYISKDKNKMNYLFLYLTIFLHSLLDFDFSYTVVFIIIVMIVAFVDYDNVNSCNYNLSIKNKTNLIMSVIILTFSLYLIIINSIVFIGDKYAAHENYVYAKKMYTINSKITFKNPEIYSKIAQIYNEESKKYSDKSKRKIALNNCRENLEKANSTNPKDPRIIGNLAFINEKIHNNKDTIMYYNSFLHNEKFYYKIYKLYYEYLFEQSKNSHDSIYKDELIKLKNMYDKNIKLLNPKSKYMNDQMPVNFYEMLKKS